MDERTKELLRKHEEHQSVSFDIEYLVWSFVEKTLESYPDYDDVLQRELEGAAEKLLKEREQRKRGA